MKGFPKPPKCVHGCYLIFGRRVFLCGASSGARPKATELEPEITCENCLARLARLDRELERGRRDDDPQQRLGFPPDGLRLIRGGGHS